MNSELFLPFAIIALLFLVLLSWMGHEAIMEIRALRRLLKKDMENHQAWLFNQLYTMAPGKVLKPDEVEVETKGKPAEVYNPNKDPMREFTGGMNDWE